VYGFYVQTGNASGATMESLVHSEPLVVSNSLRYFLTQPPIQWVLGVKRPGHEDNYSPSTNAEFKNAWRYTSTPQYVFMAFT